MLGPVDSYEPPQFEGQEDILPPQPATDEDPIDVSTLPSTISETVDVQLNIEGQEWKPVSIEIERSFYEQIDTAKIIAVPPEEPVFEQRDVVSGANGLRVTIDATSGGNDEQPMQRIYTGVVGNTFNKGDGTWFIRCVNVMSTLVNKTVDVSESDEVPAIKLLRNALESDNAIASDGFVINEGVGTLDVSQDIALGLTGEPKIDAYVTFEKDEVSFSKVLDELARLTNSLWWVDRFNRLKFGGVEGFIQLVEFVENSSAGKQTPPYRSVRVVGDGVASKDGWEGDNFISEIAVRSDYQVPDNSEGFSGISATSVQEQVDNISTGLVPASGNELKEPTFVFKSKQIKTQEQADNTAAKLIDKLIEQTAGGHVMVVGNPAIGIHDKISLPERFGRGQRPEYIVEKVTHRINDQDGFLTRVDCGGLSTKHTAYYTQADQDVIKDVPNTQFANNNFEFT